MASRYGAELRRENRQHKDLVGLMLYPAPLKGAIQGNPYGSGAGLVS